jgi:hypothetical protein
VIGADTWIDRGECYQDGMVDDLDKVECDVKLTGSLPLLLLSILMGSVGLIDWIGNRLLRLG